MERLGETGSLGLQRGNQIFPTNTVGAVQLLGEVGIAPVRGRSMLSTTLKRVFSDAQAALPATTPSTPLEEEFLNRYPEIRRNPNTFSALEQVFSPQSPTQPARIVEFLDSKKESPTSATQTNPQSKAFNNTPLQQLLNYFAWQKPGQVIDTYA